MPKFFVVLALSELYNLVKLSVEVFSTGWFINPVVLIDFQIIDPCDDLATDAGQR